MHVRLSVVGGSGDVTTTAGPVDVDVLLSNVSVSVGQSIVHALEAYLALGVLLAGELGLDAEGVC